MKVLNIHGVGDARLDDYVLPETGPNDVVVKMKACSICGSNLSYIKIGGIMRDAESGTNLLPIPEGIPYDVAAMCEPLAVAMHGVNRADVKPGDKVVVFGCVQLALV